MKVTVYVKPGSSKGPLINRGRTGELTVFIREKATENRANTALISLLADYFKTSKTNIKIINGNKSRRKIVEVIG